MSDWKPTSYNSVSPYLVVKDAQITIEFLKRTFDAIELRRLLRKNGSIMHVELRIEDTVIMVGDPGENWPNYTAHLHVYVQDAEATYVRAMEFGGTPVIEPFSNEGDPDLRGAFKDPGGNTWWVATQVKSVH